MKSPALMAKFKGTPLESLLAQRGTQGGFEGAPMPPTATPGPTAQGFGMFARPHVMPPSGLMQSGPGFPGGPPIGSPTPGPMPMGLEGPAMWGSPHQQDPRKMKMGKGFGRLNPMSMGAPRPEYDAGKI